MLLRKPLCALIGALLTTSAQSEPEAAEETRRSARMLDQIQVTASRQGESVFDAPVPVTVIGREQIDAAAPQVAMDLLHGEPGTFVQQTTPGQGVVIIRGLKGSEVLHLVDGFRLNTAFFRNAPNQYMALVDSQLLDRIEVVRGPAGTLYGGDAMGGVVQLFSETPDFSGSELEARGRLRAIFASADDSLLSRASAAIGNQDWSLSAGGTWQDVDELRVGGGDTLPFTSFSARAGNAKLVWRPADNQELTLQTQYLKQPSTPRHDELVPGFGQVNPGSVLFLFEPQARQFSQLRWRWEGGASWFDSVELQIGRQKIIDDRRSREFGSNNEEREQNSSELYGYTVQMGRQAGAHRLSWGAELYRDEVRSFRDRLNVQTGLVSARPSRFPDGSTMDTWALYLADDVQLSEALDLRAGLRWNRAEVELPPNAGGLGVGLRARDWSGDLGLRYRLDERVNLLASYGRGFRAPNIFDLGTFGDRPSNRFNIPNPGLDSETVDTFDVGLKWSSDQFEGELVAYRSSYRDKITSVLTGEVTDSGRLVTQSRNVTRLELWGVEGGLRWYPGDSVETYITATYTRGDEKLAGDVNAADRVPPLFGKLGLLWRPDEKWTLEGYSLYATRQDRLSPRDRVDPRINPAGTAGWMTVNARADYRFSETLRVGLRAENLTDKRYREHGTGLDEPGRNWILSVDWRL